MEFKFTDALILHCIYVNEKSGKETDCTSIIAYADYIDHSILTYHDFSDSIKKLSQAGLLVKGYKSIVTSSTYKVYYTERFKIAKRMYVQMIIEEIKQYLNSSFKHREMGTENDCFISREEYAILLENYKIGFTPYK